MKYNKRRWIILAASCLINLCIGSMYAWSVFATPMAVHLNELAGLSGESILTASSLAIVFTIANSVGPISMISGGFINEKFGPRWVIFFGGLLFGLGLFFSSLASNTTFLTVTYGLGCGLGMGFVYGCTISNTVKFFPDKRGLCGGIATASYGISSVLVPPIANHLIDSMGIVNTFRVLGAVFMIIICTAAIFIEKCPVGYTPEGWVPKTAKVGALRVKDKNWKQMLGDPVFYIMILMLMCGAFSGLMVISQTSPMAQNIVGVTPAVAAITVSILALFNAAGRILAGYVSDKIGRINTLTIVFFLSIIGLTLISLCGKNSMILFMAAISIIGLCFGSFMGIFPGFNADQFGVRNNSVNYGIMFIGFSLAGIFGPTIVGMIVSTYGNYNKAFLVAGVLSVCGIILTYLYRGIYGHRREEKNQSIS